MAMSSMQLSSESEKASSATRGDAEDDDLLIFRTAKRNFLLEEGGVTKANHKDLVFVHVPMNFGTAIALSAAVGSGSNLYDQMTMAAESGWSKVSKMVDTDNPVWGRFNPDLQGKSTFGYPMYYTPSKYWPVDKKYPYFGNKRTFGILRDPYERILALFRTSISIYDASRGWDFRDDRRNCAEELNEWVKSNLKPLVLHSTEHPQNVDLHVQAGYFEGDNPIEEVLDMDSFPQSANELLQKHGYNVSIGVDDMFHYHGCDDTFVDDLNAESKNLIEFYYARDFKLRCDKLGHCDKTKHHCVVQAPGMCPKRLYNWDDATHRYVRK
jgi:hypothetical protein